LEQLMRMKEIEKQRAKEGGKRLNRPAIGTRLVREYHGVEHHVTVTRNGFEYEGRTFRSLSQIAREITGSPWSGPLFFGLVQKDKGAKKRRTAAKGTRGATAAKGTTA